MGTDDGRVIDLLAADGALTADQARRVRAQLARGKSLAAALQSTPLVDPLQLAKAQQRAAEVPPVLGAAARSSMAEQALAGIESSDDDTINEMLQKVPEVRRPKIPALDPEPAPAAPAPPRRPKIPSLDPDPVPAVPAAGEPPRRPKIPSLDPQPKPSAPAPAEAPNAPMTAADWDRRLQEAMRARQGGTEASAPEAPRAPVGATPAAPASPNRRLELPGAAETYLRPESAKLKYDLANDEGINLIKELNGILIELVDMEGRGIEIEALNAKEGEVRFYSGSGALSMQRKLEGDRALKLINRLKVMARIEPWRKDSPRGAFEIRHFAARRMVHLQIGTRPQEGELATCYLIQPG